MQLLNNRILPPLFLLNNAKICIFCSAICNYASSTQCDKSFFLSNCDDKYGNARLKSDLKLLDQIVSERIRRLRLPESILGRVARKESMEVLPHLKRIKSSPQASVPLCMIENPAIRHLHNCFSHSKLPHLDEKYKRLSSPSAFATSVDLKPELMEGELRKRGGSFPTAQMMSGIENGNNGEKFCSIQEDFHVPNTLVRGSLHEEQLSEAMVQFTSHTVSKGNMLPNKDLLFDRMVSQRSMKSGCLPKPVNGHNILLVHESPMNVNDEILQTMNQNSYFIEEPCVEITFGKIRRASSHVSSKSSLQSIVE